MPRRPSDRTCERAAPARRWRPAGDRGASSIELVLYTPLLFFVIFLTVQFALSWYGNEIASAVARETARTARAGGGDASAFAAARERGFAYADAVGEGALRDVEIVVTPLPAEDAVRVTVSGRSVEIVAGFAPRVGAVVEGPVESFRPDL